MAIYDVSSSPLICCGNEWLLRSHRMACRGDFISGKILERFPPLHWYTLAGALWARLSGGPTHDDVTAFVGVAIAAATPNGCERWGMNLSKSWQLSRRNGFAGILQLSLRFSTSFAKSEIEFLAAFIHIARRNETHYKSCGAN